MTTAVKMVFEDMPDTIVVPEELRHRSVECIFIVDEPSNVWESDFASTYFGSIPDMFSEMMSKVSPCSQDELPEWDRM